MAEDLQDVSLMARIEGGDLIVLEAKISFSVQVSLMKKVRQKQELLLNL